MTLSSLPALIKGLMKSTQNAAIDNTHVHMFQAAATQEISSRWEVEMAYKDADSNISIIVAALGPRFCRLKLLSPDESLKLQVKVQALVVEAKKRVKENQQQQHATKAKTSAGITEKRFVSLLDALLGSDSVETSSPNVSGDESDVINREKRFCSILENSLCLKVQILCSGGR